MRPYIYVTAEKSDNLRSVQEARESIKEGRSARLWQELLSKVETESREPVWTPATPHPQRTAGAIRHQNREYVIVALVANRIQDGALAALLTGDRRYVEAVLLQIRSIYDPKDWPELEDLTHLRHGDHCSLRRGQLAFAIGTAYDWMHSLLTDAERTEIVDGFDRRFTAAFRAALAAGDRWTNWNNNFISSIYGGFGIAAMCFGEDYAQSAWLRQICIPRMDEYAATLFGPEGEFRESVQYAGSVGMVAHYLMARRYDGAEAEPFRACGFDRFCRWYMHCTLPPGRVLGFGDPLPDMPPLADYFVTVAAALQEPLFQWFYLQYADLGLETTRKRALEILYYDPSVAAQSPEGILPRGKAFDAIAKIISSRSSWDPHSATSVVYAKADPEENHYHADWGQLCMDGFGERLLVDLGSPKGGYPLGKKGEYYNYQQLSHNVLMIGAPDRVGTPLGAHRATVGARHGQTTFAEFDDARGGAWTFDLSSVYEHASRVRRSVVHLLPRVAVVLDIAEAEAEQPFSLRWHTGAEPEFSLDGCFACKVGDAVLSARAERLNGSAELTLQHHQYQEPHNCNRLHEEYEPQREPYLELSCHATSWRSLSLFCAFGPGEMPAQWQRGAAGWCIQTPEGVVTVTVAASHLEVQNASTGLGWVLALWP